ncbi:hypothetical protein [Porphyromonas macacae]|nr:hypothetical protein [Porphyromonas macacae]
MKDKQRFIIGRSACIDAQGRFGDGAFELDHRREPTKPECQEN